MKRPYVQAKLADPVNAGSIVYLMRFISRILCINPTMVFVMKQTIQNSDKFLSAEKHKLR